jgi:hypothetical protein
MYTRRLIRAAGQATSQPAKTPQLELLGGHLRLAPHRTDELPAP